VPIDPNFFKRIIDNDPSLTRVLPEGFADDAEISDFPSAGDLITLFDVLKSNTTVTILDFKRSMDRVCIKSLCELLQINTTITTIDLSHNELVNQDLVAIVDALDKNPDTAVTTLNLNFNHFTDYSGHCLTNSQVFSNKIISLNLAGGHFLSGISFASFLPNKITTLNLCMNHICADYMDIFCSFLKRSNSLTSLDLSEQMIKPTGEKLKILCEALITNKSLNYLSLADNRLNEVDAQCLSEVLVNNHSITSLDLSYNDIGDAGTKLLSEALKTNNTLRSLELVKNAIGELGTQYLCEALVTNHSLTTLDVGPGNKIGDIGMKHICEMLKTNTNETLTSININRKELSDANLKTIIDALKTNYSLLTITTSSFEDEMWKKRPIPETISFLSRNAKILSCLQPLDALVDDISFIAGIDAEEMITELTSLVSHETILTLNETHSLAEKYRLLTALAHITNANRYMITAKNCSIKERLKLESELDALDCLLPRFIHDSLQKITFLILSHFILGGTISKQLIDKQSLAFQQLGFSLLTLSNPNVRLFAYNALFNFLNPTKNYLIENKETYENEIALLSRQKFCNIVSAAKTACRNSLAQKDLEISKMKELQQVTAKKMLLLSLETCLPECQHDLEELKKEYIILDCPYLPNFIRILPLSTHFVAQFRKHYPSCKSFFYPPLCLFSESFLVTLSQQGNLPPKEELEKYSQFTFKELKEQYVIRIAQLKAEIAKAVATCRAELETNSAINQDNDTSMEAQTSLSLTKTNGKRKIAELAIDDSSEENPAKKPKAIQEALTNNLLIFARQTPLKETTEAGQENSSNMKILS
jgi:Leucine Rich repeat